jgi:hypothetical protein
MFAASVNRIVFPSIRLSPYSFKDKFPCQHGGVISTRRVSRRGDSHSSYSLPLRFVRIEPFCISICQTLCTSRPGIQFAKGDHRSARITWWRGNPLRGSVEWACLHSSESSREPGLSTSASNALVELPATSASRRASGRSRGGKKPQARPGHGPE